MLILKKLLPIMFWMLLVSFISVACRSTTTLPTETIILASPTTIEAQSLKATWVPTQSSVEETLTIIPLPTQTSIPKVPQLISRMQLHKDYIIYVDQNTQDKQNEIWALSPGDGAPFIVLKGDGLWPNGWSPSGSYWLLCGKSQLYVASADGSGIHQIFQNQNYVLLDAIWLSDTIVLVNAYFDLQYSPDIFQIDIERNEIKKISLDGLTQVLSVNIPNGEWIGLFNERGLKLIDQQQQVRAFLDQFYIDTPQRFGFDSIQPLQDSDGFVFIGVEKKLERKGLWKASTSQSTTQLLFGEAEKEGYISSFRISPDGQLAAIVYPTSPDIYFYVLDIQSGRLLHRWVSPYTIGTPYVHWSPDSRYIVFPYQSMAPGEPANESDIVFGIQIMDVITGETQVLLKSDIIGIMEWHFLE
jgi:hypothetical protein